MSDSEQMEILSGVETLRSSLSEFRQWLRGIDTQLIHQREEVEKRLEVLEGSLSELNARWATHSPEGPDFGKLNLAVQRLLAADSQQEIIQILLRETHQLMGRAIAFLEEGGRYRAWGSVGFKTESLAGVVADDEANPIVRAAHKKRVICRSDSLSQFFPWLDGTGELPSTAVCIPLVFGDAIPVVLYADSREAAPLASLEFLTLAATLALKNAFLEKLLFSTQAKVEQVESELEHLRAERASSVVESAAPAPEPAETALQATEPTVETPAATPETLSVPAPESQDAPQVAPAEEPAASIQRQVDGKAVEPPESASAPAQEQEPQPPLPRVDADLLDGWRKEIPPAAIQYEELPEEEKRHHQEARRFARLLVSEIKLYNEEQVKEGRSLKDLYERIQLDIDRSRDMYQRRVHSDVASVRDYFHEELIRILANGDPANLGGDYPGPRLPS